MIKHFPDDYFTIPFNGVRNVRKPLYPIIQSVGIDLLRVAGNGARFPEISEALKKGREVVIREVENALVQRAYCGADPRRLHFLCIAFLCFRRWRWPGDS